MKRQIQLWGSRTFMVALVVVTTQHWGLPMYKQYFTPKKVVVFVPTAKVQMGQFTVSFHEVGTLAAEKSVPLSSGDGGKIISLVPEGTFVKAGDKVAEMDTTDTAREVRNQELTLKNAEADVVRVEAEFEMLKLSNQTELDKQQADYDFNVNELAMANKTLDKKKRLADEKLVPRDQVDQADLAVRSKELAKKKGEADLELKKKDIKSKESQKEAEVRKAKFAADVQRRNLEELRSEVKSGVLTAPAPGMVVIGRTWAGPGDYRKLQPGDQIHRRQTICELPDLSKMLVKVNVGESDVPRVRMGMPVIIRLEAIPNKIFHGTIKSISSLATEGNPMESGSTPGRKNFEVAVELKESDPSTLKPGMTADAEFVCDSIPKAVFVPLESVIEKDGKTFVYVKTPKGYVYTRVVTGKYNDNFIMITKGVHRTQVVALRDPTRPMDSQEAGTSGPGSDEKKDSKKEPAPLPAMPSAAPTKK